VYIEEGYDSYFHVLEPYNEEGFLERTERSLDDVLCHLPLPTIEGIHPSIADDYVRRRLEAGKLTRIDLSIPFTTEAASLLPSAISLKELHTSLDVVEHVLEEITCLPALERLGLSTFDLTDSIAGVLANFRGELLLPDVMQLSDIAADKLSKHEGCLQLTSLTELSDAAAKALLEHNGTLYLELDNLPESAAAILRKHPSFADDE